MASSSAPFLKALHPSVKRFKGVRKRSWGKWVSEIRIPKTRSKLWLGSYFTPDEAARAYDLAAIKLRGSSCHLNFPDSLRLYLALHPNSPSPHLAHSVSVAPQSSDSDFLPSNSPVRLCSDCTSSSSSSSSSDAAEFSLDTAERRQISGAETSPDQLTLDDIFDGLHPIVELSWCTQDLVDISLPVSSLRRLESTELPTFVDLGELWSF